MISSSPQWATSISGAVFLPTLTTITGYAALKLLRIVPGALREFRDSVAAIRETQNKMEAKIGTIEHEVQTNTGSSLKDSVVRMEARLESNSEKLTRHLDESERQIKRVDRLWDRQGPGGDS